MNKWQPDLLHGIGHTSVVALRHIVPQNGSRILLKLENENPTGSMKDLTRPPRRRIPNPSRRMSFVILRRKNRFHPTAAHRYISHPMPSVASE
jgi:hypothetical protein